MFTETIQPRFSETNAAGHIGFTVLPAWFEKGLESVYRILIPELDPERWAVIVARFDMEFLAEISHLHDVTIETTVQQIGRSSCVVVQTLKQDGRLAARARATLVHFDYVAKKSRPIEGEARAALEAHVQARS